MPGFQRMLSALRYVAKARVPHRWRLARARCPNCNGRWFLALRPDPFMTRCLGCFANLTNLSLIPVVQAHARNRAVAAAWEMSTYGATLAYLRRSVGRVYASEYFAGVAPGSYVDGVMHQDVQQASFADEALDLVTSNQVFEHVQDDMQGFRECYRVLQPGGALVFSIPLHDIPATRQLAKSSEGGIEHLEPPEYHDSRRGGPRSALCYWRHSVHDIAARVASAGFDVTLVPVNLLPAPYEPAWVVYAVKPRGKNLRVSSEKP